MAKKTAKRPPSAPALPATPVPALQDGPGRGAVPISLIAASSLKAWLKNQDARTRRWVENAGFTARPGTHLLLPAADGGLDRVLAGVPEAIGLYTLADLPGKLPPANSYRIDHDLTAAEATRAALGWLLGSYRFSAYKAQKPADPPLLVWPKGADRA
jgi:leucyl aminopeptidase